MTEEVLSTSHNLTMHRCRHRHDRFMKEVLRAIFQNIHCHDRYMMEEGINYSSTYFSMMASWQNEALGFNSSRINFVMTTSWQNKVVSPINLGLIPSWRLHDDFMMDQGTKSNNILNHFRHVGYMMEKPRTSKDNICFHPKTQGMKRNTTNIFFFFSYWIRPISKT